MTNIPYGAAGMAEFEQSDIFTQIELFSGPTPPPVTEDFPVGQNTDLPAFSVVGIVTATGNVVLSDPAAADGSQVAIGITTAPVKTLAGETKSVAVFRAGNFNPDALNWHASRDTDAERASAFRAAPAPTNIFIRKRL